MQNNDGQSSLVGPDILNLLTTGMYHTPLAIYREYIQNAADAIEGSRWAEIGHVEISINPGERNVKIRDNGPGLTHAQALRELTPIARSQKRRGFDRGFRGIGRLSGLAFADKVTFRTRSLGIDPVTQISWDGTALRANSMHVAEPGAIIQKCVEISKVSGSDWPDHFFEVEVERIARYAASELLNREAVRKYIGEVGPVPMPREFPFKEEIERLFANGSQPVTLEIAINGEIEPICRRLGAGLVFSKERADAFRGLQALRIPAIDSAKDAAIGWIAHCSYLGAIPKELGVRGLRLREGNLQIGGENVLDPLFREERFNRWCVGELHIVDERLLPNGRRDYFEPSPHMRHVENHLESIIRGIVNRCRSASSERNQARRIQTGLQNSKGAYELAASGYLNAVDARALVKQALGNLQAIEESLFSIAPCDEKTVAELASIKEELTQFRPRRGRPRLGKVPSSEIATYRRIFRVLTEMSPSPSVAKDMIESVLSQA